ncbi:MAG: aminotransferase, partial [Rhodopirellula sp. JB053]
MSDQFDPDTPNIDAPAIGSPTTDPVPHPFEVKFASRVDRLPPYMFGRINNSLYQKRRAGDDVI